MKKSKGLIMDDMVANQNPCIMCYDALLSAQLTQVYVLCRSLYITSDYREQ